MIGSRIAGVALNLHSLQLLILQVRFDGSVCNEGFGGTEKECRVKDVYFDTYLLLFLCFLIMDG